jgi:signal transduction histidine kinase
MNQARSLRFRMMLLFCAVVGLLLAGSYIGFYTLLTREVRDQLDRQLTDTARPVIADLISDPAEQDVNELSVPDEYFELLDASGRRLERSKNLAGQGLNVGRLGIDASRTVFLSIDDPARGRLRLALIPFRRGAESLVLALAIPTRDADRVLAGFRKMIPVLLLVSLAMTGIISTWYVGRSLRPVAELTRHAAETTQRLSDSGHPHLWKPLAVTNPHDELGRLAETFNRLFARVDAALRQLRQFATDASHELRTPLAVLQGETELLLSESHSAEQYRRTLHVILDELKKLSRIVEGLFTLAMADAGELRLAREPLYLNEVLEESCALVAALAGSKGIAIQRELKQEVSYLGDEVFLRQLFLILLDNAIKYSPRNTQVNVSLEQSDGVVRARFEDQGPGISSEHLPRIFDRFYRAAPGGEPQGGGLGLAIAQAIVRAQKGSIQCRSKFRSGSTFTVTLPVNNSPA